MNEITEALMVEWNENVKRLKAEQKRGFETAQKKKEGKQQS